jgi:uncharacterized membrane protein YphA (DoxX/SURF4 family)
MQNDSCCSQTGFRKWFRPNLVDFVAGLIFFIPGLTKVMAGGAAAGFMGESAFSLVGLDPASLGIIPVILGWIAIIVELVGGFVFMIGLKKVLGFAALASAVVAAVILGMEIKAASAGGKALLEVFQATQFTLLFFVVFATKAGKFAMNCCGIGCCGTACCKTEAKK